MACASPAHVGASHWFLFVAVTAFIATLLWCFVYFLSIREALKIPINWILSVSKGSENQSTAAPIRGQILTGSFSLQELLNTIAFAVLYMIAFIAQLSVWSAVNYPHTASNIAAGVSAKSYRIQIA